ncbi:MAG: L,D-transpeptidase family protein [Xanthobacteraceae bacterium]
MPGIRFDRFLVSTAILLVLSAGAGGALADPLKADIPDGAISAAPTTPDAVNAAPATAMEPDKTATPAQAAAPAATDQPTIAAPAAELATPAAAAATSQPTSSASAPATSPAVIATPAATAAPETPTPAAAATPATATPAAAAATPETTTPAATLASADAPIVDQLHNLATGGFDHVIGNKKDRTQIDAFYAGRNYAPLWITDGKANARANAAIAYLGHVDADGLDPADYPAPNFAIASSPAELAAAEIKLTLDVITYAHHASVGRVHWSRVSADIEYNTTAPESGEVLSTLAAASDVAAALDAYEPKTPGYLALKSKLADIRAGKLDKAGTPIPSGAVLKAGMQDDRVPALRERLGILSDGGTGYDKPLAEAVKKFQEQHQIAATGTLTAATVEALNGKTPDRAADIILANMERWRWAPHQFPATYVIVNLPDFTLRVMHDGKPVWTTKIVDGKPDKPTPIMTADMKYITVNPTWNVPPSIINHEYLPALAQDPTVLDRMGLKLVHNPDGSVRIYQPPGDKNALGRIRFNFPNKFLVYQHDTPDKYLFASEKRDYSHGCMRVQDPQHYAEVLLSLVRPNDGYTEDRIKRMIAEGGETDISFPTYISVNLTYQTAFVDDSGKLQFRDDMYGRDRALLAILKGDDRRVADIPVEHKEDISQREVLAIPDQASGRGIFGGGGSYYPNGGGSGGGDNFFSRLFGGFASAPPPAPHKPVPHPRKETRKNDTIER